VGSYLIHPRKCFKKEVTFRKTKKVQKMTSPATAKKRIMKKISMSRRISLAVFAVLKALSFSVLLLSK
jgi:hypothetical protein